MTLKEELKKLYKESEATKKREFLEKTLPDRLRDAAKKGYNCCTIPHAEIEYNCLSDTEIKEWCIANGLRLYTTDVLYGCYVSIYWI